MKLELYIENRGNVQMPLVVGSVKLESQRVGAPSKLTFSVLRDATANFVEGNVVRLTVDGKNMFYGFVFKKRRDKEHIIEVTAYDQLRYLKNKDTYRIRNETASDVIRKIAADFQLQLGNIENTSYIIPSREEDNSSLFDIIYTALELELMNTGNLYIFYDDFGRLTLRSLETMKVDLIIDEETGQNFDYKSSIDDTTYNRIKLTYDNDEIGKRDIYVAQSGDNINRWGVLQYFGTLREGENGEAKVNALLGLFNAKTRKLKIANALGDTRIRAGSMPIVDLHLGDIIVRNHLLVEKCTHTFNESEHWMDLTLRGGEIG